MPEILETVFSAAIQRFVASDGHVMAHRERPLPPQGYSTATIRVYEVEYETQSEHATVAPHARRA